MAKAQKGKASAFIKEAEALLAKKSWFSSSKERNAEEAAETFEKAANAYKVGGLNQEAGDAYVKAAELYRDKLSDFNNASKVFNSAGTCYKKSNPADAIQAYQQAVSLYTDSARIMQAAKLTKEIADCTKTKKSMKRISPMSFWP